MSDRESNIDCLFDLAGAVCDGVASQDDLVALNSIITADRTSRHRYMDYCRIHVALRLELHARNATDKVHELIDNEPVLFAASGSDVAEVKPRPTLPFGFLGSAFQDAVGNFSSGWPVAYLAATVVLGLGLLIGALMHVSSPVQVASGEKGTDPLCQNGPKGTPLPSPPSTLPSFVGRISGLVDCRWADPNTAVPGPVAVPLGRKYALSSGLLEITYDTGAKVILQGPCTYEVDSIAGGYLSLGKLTARVEKKAEGGRESGDRDQSQRALTLALSQGERGPSSSSALRLPPSALFSVRTPTATVTDLGTEFGVEVDREGSTTSHVFRGSVEVRVVAVDGRTEGNAQVLHENESARVDANQDHPQIVAVPIAQTVRFVRELPKRAAKAKVLDLVDVVAGGDGFSGRRGLGIDSTNGRPIKTTLRDMNLESYGPIVGDGKYHRVEALPLVDGVFVPDGRSGAVQVDSAGHTFSEFGETDGTTGMNIWAGGTVPVPSSSMPSHVSSLLDSLPPSQTLAPSRLGRIDYATPGHGLIFLHANNGITFDLEAIRRVNPDVKLLRFRATAGNVEPVSETGAVAGYADLWVLVDGQVRFRRRGINGCSGAFPILFSVADNDRFLTLAATDSGNTMAGDWILFGDPVLEIVAGEQKGD